MDGGDGGWTACETGSARQEEGRAGRGAELEREEERRREAEAKRRIAEDDYHGHGG